MIIVDSIHPNYKIVLGVAHTNTYAKTSFNHVILQSGIMRRLLRTGVIFKLEFFYNYMHDASTVDISRINWRDPFFTLSTGTPTFLANNGIGDAGTTMDTNFDTDESTGSWTQSTNAGDCHIMAYMKVGGANSSRQDLVTADDGSRLYRLAARTNPRTDGGCGEGVASPSIIQVGNTTSNTMYGMNKHDNGVDFTRSAIVNGSMSTIVTGAQGTLPSSTVLVGLNMISGRYVGAVSGGLALTSQEWSELNDIIQYLSSNL